VTFSPGAGTYTSAQLASLSTTTAGASIRYTLDGTTTPSATVGILYTGPLTVNATATIKAIAFAAGVASSTVSTAVYTINIPAAGDYERVAVGGGSGDGGNDQRVELWRVAGGEHRFVRGATATIASVWGNSTIVVNVPGRPSSSCRSRQ
jgi:hypothetical protein